MRRKVNNRHIGSAAMADYAKREASWSGMLMNAGDLSVGNYKKIAPEATEVDTEAQDKEIEQLWLKVEEDSRKANELSAKINQIQQGGAVGNDHHGFTGTIFAQVAFDRIFTHVWLVRGALKRGKR